MSLNRIELPPFLVASLYGHSLVDTGEDIPAMPREAEVKKDIPVAPKAIIPPITEEKKQEIPRQETVAGPAPKPVPETPAVTGNPLKYLGDNKKNILIVVNYPGTAYLPDDTLQFLTQLLTACRLSLGDIALVNHANGPAQPYRQLTDKLQSKTVFLYGIEPADWGLPISFPHFQLQAFAGINFLYAPVMEDIMADKLLKTKLWLSLKAIFGV